MDRLRWAYRFTVLFYLTALIGLWAAYDREAAFYKLVLLSGGIGGAIAVVVAGQRAGEEALAKSGLVAALLAGGLGSYYLWVKSGAPGSAALAFVLQMARATSFSGAEVLLSEGLQRGVAEGGFARLLPLGVVGVTWAWKARERAWFAAGMVALLVGTIALLLTLSAGAWLGLAAGVSIASYLHWCYGVGRTSSLVHPGNRAVFASLFLVPGLAVFAVFWPQVDGWVGALPGGSMVLSRVGLWREMLVLVQDYPFTGSGLANTPMAFSSYVALLNVPFSDHAYNLYLQMAIEQGLPGLGAFLGLVAVAGQNLRAAYRREGTGLLQAATTAALVTLLVHGLVDAGTYATELVLTQFLPLGFALALHPAPASSKAIAGSGTRLNVLPGAAFLVLLLVAVGLPATRATLHANLGAVAQQQVELGIYAWPRWPIQDAVRLSEEERLAAAMAHYEVALTFDGANATANRRLGQMELSLGWYEAARRHLEAAYAGTPGQRVTRLLLGESYAVAGETERAAALWRTVDGSEGQVELRHWWYTHLGDERRAAWIARAAERGVLLPPVGQ